MDTNSFFNKEIKSMKTEFKNMIDSMSNEDFLEFISFLAYCLCDDEEDWDEDDFYDDEFYDEDWYDESDEFYGETFDDFDDDEDLPF